jgi:hypothetical protein
MTIASHRSVRPKVFREWPSKLTQPKALEEPDRSPGGAWRTDAPKRQPRQRRLLFGSLAILATLAAIGAAGLGLFLIERMEGEISVRAFEDVILSWGHWGVLASIGLMVLHSFLPFPAEFVALANGMLYGPLWGTVITWVGAMLGAFLAFGLSARSGGHSSRRS